MADQLISCSINNNMPIKVHVVTNKFEDTQVLVNCLFKLAQEKCDRATMTIAVDLWRKATKIHTIHFPISLFLLSIKLFSPLQ